MPCALSILTTRKTSSSLAALLRRAKRQSAGALRHQVNDLQAGLKKLSAGLDQVDHDASAAPKKRRARPAPTPKPASSGKPAPRRKRKKAA